MKYLPLYQKRKCFQRFEKKNTLQSSVFKRIQIQKFRIDPAKLAIAIQADAQRYDKNLIERQFTARWLSI